MVRDTISILIPTWRRPQSLVRCVRALGIQTRKADQIVVTIREDDVETWAAIRELKRACGETLQPLTTPAVNLTAAMSLGLAATAGSLVALTDDDVEPHPDWLAKVEAAFTSPDIGGVGGRDWQPHERWDEPNVGTLSWYGRVVGNHHLGSGPPRDVQLLKGANCCFRGEVLRRIGFDHRLRGKGNVSHWEMAVCFAFLREGYRLIYDPSIAVDHHVEQRHDGDINARGGFDPESYANGAFNEVLAILTHLQGARGLSYRLWSRAVGTRALPGWLQLLRLCLARREPLSEVLARVSIASRQRAAAKRALFEAKSESIGDGRPVRTPFHRTS